MTVYFIGSGPGAPDLLTLRAHNIISSTPLCLYAGSLVPKEITKIAPKDAQIIDTSNLILDEIIDIMRLAHNKNLNVSRLHSGDPAIYGAISEQMKKLDELHIDYQIIPGVNAFSACAALLKCELTMPIINQSIILTREEGNSTPLPSRQKLEMFAAAKAALIIHLSIRKIKNICRKLIPFYGKDCPCAVVYKATQKNQKIIRSTLENIAEKVKKEKITREALIIISYTLAPQKYHNSALYSPSHAHIFRPNPKKANVNET